MPDEYLLGDKAWATIEPLLPTVYAGARRHDDRRIISGIVHVLRQRLSLEGLSGDLWPLHDRL
jgi:transposase